MRGDRPRSTQEDERLIPRIPRVDLRSGGTQSAAITTQGVFCHHLRLCFTMPRMPVSASNARQRLEWPLSGECPYASYWYCGNCPISCPKSSKYFG